MRETLRLGRVNGIAVGVNWSVLVIFALITLGLAAGRFPDLYPDLPAVAYGAAGLAAGVLFFASLLAHELSHAIVAQRNGVGVDGITLWLFGGVARLTGEARDPGADFRIAGVGPLVSIVLGIGFGVFAAVLDVAGMPGLVVGVLAWLGIINIVLAVFNLVPAAPLDGGRLLRAALWRWRGDREAAAVVAARAGRGFGWLLVVLGIASFAFGGPAGLWTALIGWFLVNAAKAEEQQVVVDKALEGVRVRDVMSRHPTVAPRDVTVDRFLDYYVFPSRYSSFPVVDDVGSPVGLVTLNRVKEVPPDQRATTAVGELSCPVDDLVIVGPDEPLSDVVPRMSGCADGRALVVDGGRLVGIVTPSDVMRRLETAELRKSSN